MAQLQQNQRKKQAQGCGCLSVLVVVVVVAIVSLTGNHSSNGDQSTSLPTDGLSSDQPTDTLAPVSQTSTPTPPPATPTTAPVAISANPTAAAVGGSGCYIDPEGNCYRAGEFCPSSLYGQTVQGANGPIKCENVNGWRWESV